MSKDNYEFLCENAAIAEEMGISKRDLMDICCELRKEDLAHANLQASIERRVCEIPRNSLKKHEKF